jgi:hypothetical protein
MPESVVYQEFREEVREEVRQEPQLEDERSLPFRQLVRRVGALSATAQSQAEAFSLTPLSGN